MKQKHVDYLQLEIFSMNIFETLKSTKVQENIKIISEQMAIDIWKDLGNKDKVGLVENTLLEWGVEVEKEKIEHISPITEEIKFKSELVGRDNELKKLKSIIEKTKQGRGHVVFLEGEAGVGKTRLMTEFAEHAESTGMRFLYGRGLEGSTPYLPFVDALRGYFGGL